MMTIARVLLLLLAVAAVSAQETPPPPNYACDGFAEPLRTAEPMELRPGRVLPLKGRLAAADAKNADDTVLRTAPVVSLIFKPGEGPEVDKSGELEVWDYGKGKSFIYLADPDPHWKFDLGTAKLAAGRYLVTLVSGDPKEYTIDPVCRLELLIRR
jgi:hypothetical protein